MSETKGWKINLKPYTKEVIQGIKYDDPEFDVKDTMAGLCFNQALQLDPEAMFKAKDIADKIRGSKDSVILDNAEMEHIRKAYKCIKGAPEYFIEFMRRIRDAEEVSMHEVKK